MYITRIAPSPTGDMHIGTLRTAYFNYLAAKASGGRFILRIDDTDIDRNDDSKVLDIINIMKWCKLNPDDIFYQSERLDRYAHAAEQLLDQNKAYVDNGAVRLLVSNFPEYWLDSLIGPIKVKRISEDKDGQMKDLINHTVLIKSNGYPTYNFASVIDDIDLGINYVIRGTDHIDNTSIQATLYDAFHAAQPKYAHVGLIHQNKKKMSKRDDAASVLNYRDQGYDPDALLNFVLRMGWGPYVDDRANSILPRNRALAIFLDGGKMRPIQSNFDQAKLDWFNKKYKNMKKND